MALRATVLPAGLILLVATGAAPADASRKPTRSESRAIKKAFFKNHPKADTKIGRIRVSTVDRRFAAVRYRFDVPTETARAAAVRKLPPELLKRKAGGTWKPVLPAKAPKKVVRELKVKSRTSLIRISGDVDAILTRGATCSPGSGAANIYDPASDVYLSIQFFDDAYTGPGWYPALGVRSLAGIYVDDATELRWQTGQSNDYFQPSGTIYAGGTWGVIEATMARVTTDTHEPQTVTVSGSWSCR
jgi:hypothetical protein